MSDQAVLFPRSETRSFFDALDRHEKRYGPGPDDAKKSAAAVRAKLRDIERRDALCQGFFNAMMRPPRRRQPS